MTLTMRHFYGTSGEQSLDSLRSTHAFGAGGQWPRLVSLFGEEHAFGAGGQRPRLVSLFGEKYAFSADGQRPRLVSLLELHPLDPSGERSLDSLLEKRAFETGGPVSSLKMSKTNLSNTYTITLIPSIPRKRTNDSDNNNAKRFRTDLITSNDINNQFEELIVCKILEFIRLTALLLTSLLQSKIKYKEF